MIWLTRSGDGDILNVMTFFKASLEAGAIAGRHRRLWSDGKSKLPLFVVTFVSWASLYLVKLLSVADAV
jgi:hypothetical protein